MGILASPSVSGLLTAAQLALSTTQEGLGAIVGVSRKTMGWWMQGRTLPADFHVFRIAEAVHPKDPALAAKLAAAAGSSLAALGLEKAAAPPDPRLSLGLRHMGALVVCAAAEALDASPRAVRPAIVAAFASAKELGLSVDDALAALAASGAGEAKGGRSNRERRREGGG